MAVDRDDATQEFQVCFRVRAKIVRVPPEVKYPL
jgi:hypothetical protein